MKYVIFFQTAGFRTVAALSHGNFLVPGTFPDTTYIFHNTRIYSGGGGGGLEYKKGGDARREF